MTSLSDNNDTFKLFFSAVFEYCTAVLCVSNSSARQSLAVPRFRNICGKCRFKEINWTPAASLLSCKGANRSFMVQRAAYDEAANYRSCLRKSEQKPFQLFFLDYPAIAGLQQIHLEPQDI